MEQELLGSGELLEGIVEDEDEFVSVIDGNDNSDDEQTELYHDPDLDKDVIVPDEEVD